MSEISPPIFDPYFDTEELWKFLLFILLWLLDLLSDGCYTQLKIVEHFTTLPQTFRLNSYEPTVLEQSLWKIFCFEKCCVCCSSRKRVVQHIITRKNKVLTLSSYFIALCSEVEKMQNFIFPLQNKSTKVSKQVEEIIDEKCRILNKTGTARGSAIHHLSLWMKGQLDCVVIIHIFHQLIGQIMLIFVFIFLFILNRIATGERER